MAPASGAARLKGHHSLGRKAVMNNRRWLSVAAVTIASATLALAGSGHPASSGRSGLAGADRLQSARVATARMGRYLEKAADQ